tara:strand:- start:914 stop:2467 length:1554 start_codon:yes stop_codon:yes gene_type:complete
MGLNVTVSKGHDFTSGNVTRAALNAGATPTIAITGSISGSELADNSVTNAKIPAGANIDISKLQLTSNNLIIGDGNDKASALAPVGSSSGPTSGKELLVNTGTGFALKGTGTSGDVDVDYAFGAVRFTLKDEAVEGRHLNPNSLDDDYLSFSSDKITINNSSIGVDKLKKEGTAGYILTSNGSSKNPEYKELEIAESPVFETTGTADCYYLVPSSTTKIRIQAVGGGGGGGVGDLDGTDHGSSGGGAGAFVQSDFSVSGNGGVKTLNSSIGNSGGTNYSTAVGLATTGGTGTGATITIQSVNGNGAVQTVALTSGGSGYTAGDVLTIVQPDRAGGSTDATVTVDTTQVCLLKIKSGAAGAVNNNGGDTYVYTNIVAADSSSPAASTAAPTGDVLIKAVAGLKGNTSGNTAGVGGAGGAASNCQTGSGAYNIKTYSGGKGGDGNVRWYGETPITTNATINGGHGGHSRLGASSLGLQVSVSGGAQGYGYGGRGHNDVSTSSDNSSVGGRGHVKIFLLN